MKSTPNKSRPYPSFPRLRKELVKRRARILKMLNSGRRPMNAEQFDRLAKYAVERADTGLHFLDEGRVEEAAICAILSAEGFMHACQTTGEPYVSRGQQALLKSLQGHEKVYGTIDEKNKRNAELQAFIEKLQKLHPEVRSHTALCALAAKDRNCPYTLSGRAIQRNTNNPFK